MRETIVQTERIVRCDGNAKPASLILVRRFIGAISSITVDGTALEASDYEIDRGAGLLRRLCGSSFVDWPQGTTVVSYTAGFVEIPGALKRAAVTVLREQASADSRDPSLKSLRQKTDGLSETEWGYWVNSAAGGTSSAISGPASAMLDPYRYWTV
ncbi:hypothetical protein [Methylosinus sporium]|uniref:hypothetical protein n=1 Tax=Methylosinus sporium TaxID=428 RepID=UPI001AEE3797|nr:hypothetical protein [Methylosinus sporium]